MSYYKTCPHCGSHLDPGEKCDCESKEKASIKDFPVISENPERENTANNAIRASGNRQGKPEKT